VRQLPFRDAVIDLEASGAGKFLGRLEVNGKEVRGTRKIPAGLLKGDVKIVCRRTETAPDSPVILSLHGATVHAVEIDQALQAQVSGFAAAWLYFYSPLAPRVILEGKAVEAIATEQPGIYRALLPLKNNAPLRLEIGAGK
jgi:hypothetical protein